MQSKNGIIRQIARLFCGHQPEIKELNKLINNYKKAISELTGPPLPDIGVVSLASSQVMEEIEELNFKMMYPVLLDSGQPYYYTKAEDWAEVFDYIYFKYPMPKYIAARMDCEGFAIWMMGLIQAEFGLNYFGLVLGNSPGGYHCWNIFQTDNGLVQFEPQTGEFFGIGKEGYFPEYLLL